MKHLFFLVLLFVPLSNCPAQSPAKTPFSAKDFTLRTGVNISGWLSQSKERGVERKAFFTEADVEWIASKKFDHIRLPVDEEHLWDAKGKPEKEGFDLLRRAISWGVKHNIRVILDLHNLRTHHSDGNENKLWTDSLAEKRFISCWKELSDAVSGFPREWLAYELLNEPVATNCEDWNSVLRKAAAAIRKKEPKRILVVGSNLWQQPMTFACLKPPAKDDNIILSFHFYSPMILTHYKASWLNTGKYTGSVRYPGQVVSDDELSKLEFEFSKQVESKAGNWSRKEIENEIQKAFRESQKMRHPLYCGEFGCLNSTPKEERLRWFTDVTDVFRTLGIGYSLWNYKDRRENGFGIRAVKEPKADEDLLKILLKR